MVTGASRCGTDVSLSALGAHGCGLPLARNSGQAASPAAWSAELISSTVLVLAAGPGELACVFDRIGVSADRAGETRGGYTSYPWWPHGRFVPGTLRSARDPAAFSGTAHRWYRRAVRPTAFRMHSETRANDSYADSPKVEERWRALVTYALPVAIPVPCRAVTTAYVCAANTTDDDTPIVIRQSLGEGDSQNEQTVLPR